MNGDLLPPPAPPVDLPWASAGGSPFAMPYRNEETAWRDAGFFARRYHRPVRVVPRDGAFWLEFVVTNG